MTQLRKMILGELQRRHYDQHTTRSYIRTVEDFSRRFNCSLDRLGPRHIREYQLRVASRRCPKERKSRTVVNGYAD